MSTPELIAMLTRVDAATRKWKLSKNRADEMDVWDAIAALDKHSVDLAREVVGLRSTEAALRTSLIDQEYALSQTLGRALGLLEEDGQIQTFDLTAEDLAGQAVAELAKLRALAAQAEAEAGDERLRDVVRQFERNGRKRLAPYDPHDSQRAQDRGYARGMREAAHILSTALAQASAGGEGGA